MASIYKRKNNDGTAVWRAVVRIKGYPTVCNHFERKQEAEDWASGIERQIKLGEFKFDQHNQVRTFTHLTQRYLNDGTLEHHRSAKDTRRHLTYWESRFAAYALMHLTPELIGKERQRLLELPTHQGKKRTSATVNRYIASLSLLDFANKLAYLKETKNGRPRSIALSDSVLKELKNLYERREPLKPLVFASKTAFGRIDIKKAWQTALRVAEIEKCRAHDMRHTLRVRVANR